MEISGYSMVSGELSNGIRISKNPAQEVAIVRFWPVADIATAAANVRFRG
jgi:hypothetical protein